MRAMFEARHDVTPGGGVGAELVGDHAPRATALLLGKLPQQAPGRLGIAPSLHDLVEDIAVLIDRPPQSVLRAADGDDDLAKVSDVAQPRSLALQSTGIIGSKLHRPTLHGFIGDDDTALHQHFLHQAQAQRKAKVKPQRMGDDRRWKSVALVSDGQAHATPSTWALAISQLT